jgi:hypothetical protein
MFDPIRQQHEYSGEATSVKFYDQHFGGYGFGWDRATRTQ